jgi:hypothetical protein
VPGSLLHPAIPKTRGGGRMGIILWHQVGSPEGWGGFCDFRDWGGDGACGNVSGVKSARSKISHPVRKWFWYHILRIKKQSGSTGSCSGVYE